MPIGSRHLTVLGEFKPFGLIAEALDGGKSPEIAHEDYSYFLFDPEITRERDASVGCDFSPSDSCGHGGGEHELFIRGNRYRSTSLFLVHSSHFICFAFI